jgi:hypothetical protein
MGTSSLSPLDLSAGDTIAFADDMILIKLVSKPSITDPKGEVGNNNIFLYKPHVVFYEHRQVKKMSISAEQRIEYEKTIKAITKKGVEAIH